MACVPANAVGDGLLDAPVHRLTCMGRDALWGGRKHGLGLQRYGERLMHDAGPYWTLCIAQPGVPADYDGSAMRSSLAATMKSFSGKPLIFFVFSETVT